MTETETLERAKMYMEKLANGINPIDDSIVADDDVINNVRLSRCFFYVADILRQVIDNGGVIPQVKAKKLPFYLTIDERNGFEFSNQPIPVSDIARRINALIEGKNMAKLSHRAITQWLISLNMLEEASNGDGKNVKHPTQSGESMGITSELRTYDNRSYTVVVYDLEAQHFILDNLDAIIEQHRSKKENQGRPWLPIHDEYLKDLYEHDVPINEIAITLKRTNAGVRERLKKLGLIV